MIAEETQARIRLSSRPAEGACIEPARHRLHQTHDGRPVYPERGQISLTDGLIARPWPRRKTSSPSVRESGSGETLTHETTGRGRRGPVARAPVRLPVRRTACGSGTVRPTRR
jgi:hypothetical protein